MGDCDDEDDMDHSTCNMLSEWSESQTLKVQFIFRSGQYNCILATVFTSLASLTQPTPVETIFTITHDRASPDPSFPMCDTESDLHWVWLPRLNIYMLKPDHDESSTYMVWVYSLYTHVQIKYKSGGCDVQTRSQIHPVHYITKSMGLQKKCRIQKYTD